MMANLQMVASEIKGNAKGLKTIECIQSPKAHLIGLVLNYQVKVLEGLVHYEINVFADIRTSIPCGERFISHVGLAVSVKNHQ